MTASPVDLAGTRHLELQSMVALLREQKARAVDVIAGAGAIRAVGGNLVLDGTEPQLTDAGVTMTAGTYGVNDIAQSGIADKLGIPTAYLRRMAGECPELYDENVNTWLARDPRRFLIRCLRGEAGTGVARAFLSDRYNRIENLDVLLAALQGIRDSGTPVDIAGCDLSERRMYVRVTSPQVQVLSPQLLGNYRSPFDGRRGADLPVISGGFIIANSETGCGAFSVAPWLRFEVCRNGLVVKQNALRRAHLGAQLTDEDGVIIASAETQRRNLDLITAKTTDAVRSFLDVDYVTRIVRELEVEAGAEVADPDTTIKLVGQKLRYSDEQQTDILNHFIRGGDLSAGGIMHAVTSVAQTLTDADAAHEMESTAIAALRLAAAAA
ncbi:hypothetical protein GCM10010123_02280 [Pilimelia anulata]|uniref:DUF932 domain-containing protein n=2 Tax=Pilimelia anulata TaxID=53371 RepID=A0A8J3B6T7_9ACTN|nr:hypothetical protein GCM10010123_02280 [Pilimelia anulata]